MSSTKLGRPHKIETTGTRYGHLTVIGYGGYNGKHTHSWRCKCDCGNEVIVRGDCLRRGQTKSCGCLRTILQKGHPCYTKLPEGIAARNDIIRHTKYNARIRNLEWALTDKQLISVMQSPCHYCGIELSNEYSHPTKNGSFKYNGLDRKDNDKGYTPDNTLPCCWRCNRAKQKDTYADFMKWIKQVTSHQNL